MKVKYIDILKALGIFTIVYGHANAPFGYIFALYGVPMFFFISGYLYKDEYSNNPIKLIKRRFKTLYLPYLTYQVIFIILHNLLIRVNIYTDGSWVEGKFIKYFTLKDIFIEITKAIFMIKQSDPIIGAFWFVISLIIVNIIFALISCFIERVCHENKELKRLTIILVLFTISNLLTKCGISIPRLSPALTMTFIFYVGYLYKKRENVIKFSNKYINYCILMLFLLSSLYGRVTVAMNSYLSPDFLVFCSLMGIYLNICLAKLLERKNVLMGTWKFIGNNTMIILALHMLSFRLVSIIAIKINNLPIEYLSQHPTIDKYQSLWFFYTISGIIIPLLIKKYIINNVRLLFNHHSEIKQQGL